MLSKQEQTTSHKKFEKAPNKASNNIYCCPVKVNRKLCISLSIGIAAVLLIQRLGFQFQTVSIIECTYFDKKGPITTDNSKKL